MWLIATAAKERYFGGTKLTRVLVTQSLWLLLLPGGCSDSSSGTGVDAGLTPVDGATSDTGSVALEDAATSTECPITGPVKYVVAGGSLFRITLDGLLAERIATVKSGKTGGSLGSNKFARAGSGELIVSNAECPLCVVDPTKVANGSVTADVLRSDISPVMIGDSGSPQEIVVVENAGGNKQFGAFNISTKAYTYATKLTLSAAGVICNGDLLDIDGSIGNGTYSLNVLVECSDGNSGAVPAYLTTSGTFTTTAPFMSTPLTHTVLAWSKNSVSNYAVASMDPGHAVFLAPPNQVFHIVKK